MSAVGYYKALMNKDTSPSFSYLYDVEPFDRAFSVSRLLKSDYLGSAIEVEESSGSTSSDIGYSDNLLDESSLSTFVGANDGNVLTAYDQSGNGYDWTEGDAGKKPLIVDSGVIQKINTFPSINFNNDNHRLFQAIQGAFQPYCLFIVFQQTTTGLSGNRWIVGPSGTGSAFNVYVTNSSGNIIAAAGVNQQLYAENTNYNLLTIMVNSTSSIVRLNGVQIFSGNLGTFGTSAFTLGRYYNNSVNLKSPYFKLNEFVVYESDVSSSITDIEDNINNFYSIY